MVFAAAASAQVGTFYTFSQSVGTYTPITGGTVISTATSANTLDDVTFSVPLPFPFVFDNVSQTNVQVQTNGHLAFGAVSPGTTYAPLSSTVVVPGFVSACGRDLQGGYVFASTRTLGSNQVTGVSALGPLQIGDTLVGTGIPAGTTITAIVGNTLTMSALATATSTATAVTAYGPWSEMRYELQGTSPNQVFVVQWKNFRRFGTTLTTNNGTYYNFQIRLHENGVIDCAYGDCQPGVGTTTTAIHQVGLRGPNNTFPANVNLRQSTKGTNDWDTSVAGTTNAVGHPFNAVAPANVITNGLTYTWSPPAGTIATNTSLGSGCGGSPLGDGSFYQLFDGTTSINDVANTSFTMVWSGSGYAVIPGASAVVPPVGAALTGGDDVTFPLTLPFAFPCPRGNITQAWLCTNGWLEFESTTSTDYTETVAELLANGTRLAFLWDDMNSTSQGTINAELDGSGVYQITFTNVPEFSTTNSNNVQVSLWPNGNIEVKYGALAMLDGLVGLSTGVAATDPGGIDLTTALPIVVNTGFFVPNLSLAAVTRPVIGTSWDMTTSGIPFPGITLEIVGLSDPGIPDLFFLGMPGCQLRCSLDVILGPGFGSPSAPRSLPIPNTASLVGSNIYAQSASLAPGVNSFGFITSNGIQGLMGDL